MFSLHCSGSHSVVGCFGICSCQARHCSQWARATRETRSVASNKISRDVVTLFYVAIFLNVLMHMRTARQALLRRLRFEVQGSFSVVPVTLLAWWMKVVRIHGIDGALLFGISLFDIRMENMGINMGFDKCPVLCSVDGFVPARVLQ